MASETLCYVIISPVAVHNAKFHTHNRISKQKRKSWINIINHNTCICIMWLNGLQTNKKSSLY